MSGVLGYALGYDAGRSDAEISRQRREIVDEVFYGQRIVQVDQSYLDQLHQLVEKFRSNSIYNFDKGEQFYAEALEWKADAQRNEAHAAALQVEVAALQAQLAGCPPIRRRRRLLGSGPYIKRPTKKSGASTSSV